MMTKTTCVAEQEELLNEEYGMMFQDEQKVIHKGAITLDTSIRLNIRMSLLKRLLRQPRDGSRRRPCMAFGRYPEPGVTGQIQGQDQVQVQYC